ncbi:hypothetical protein EIP86_003960 [Pleurotus ostreatoroseus]|nr:hypothetical protein EIP86_003960 [Pleurotus ostreatoroseus]
MATDLPSAATQADLRMPVPSGPLPIGSWASLTSPLERVGDPEALVGGDYFAGTLPAGENAHAIVSDRMKDKNNESVKQPNKSRTVDIQCDSLVIAAGCWTPRVYRTLFPNAGRIPRVTALAGHSVVFKSKRWQPVEPKLSNISIAENKAQKTTNKSANEDSGVSALASSDSSGRTVKGPSIPTSGQLTAPVTISDRVCHAIFTGDHAGYSPEIFSRLNGDIWLGGLNSSSIPLPPLASHAVPEASALATLLHTAHSLCGTPGRDAASLQVVRSALCFRPVAPTGRPVLARMHEADLGDGAKVPGGVFVATGHGPWGISLSLGTGYVMGEMVLGKETSVDVRALGRWEAQAP